MLGKLIHFGILKGTQNYKVHGIKKMQADIYFEEQMKCTSIYPDYFVSRWSLKHLFDLARYTSTMASQL